MKNYLKPTLAVVITVLLIQGVFRGGTQALYRLRKTSLRASCGQLVPGMSQADVLDIMEGTEPTAEYIDDNGISFEGEGICQVKMSPASRTSMGAVFSAETTGMLNLH